MISKTTDRLAAVQDFESIARQFRPKIFRFILASTRDSETADNLTQDCLLRAFQGFRRFRGDCRPDTWLLQIAVNLVRDYGRNRRLQFWKRSQSGVTPLRSLENTLPDGGQSPEVNALRNERLRSIWTAADHLSERQRTVFLLRFVEDMELLEIAAATGMAEGTVKVHLFRAVQAVRNQIGVGV